MAKRATERRGPQTDPTPRILRRRDDINDTVPNSVPPYLKLLLCTVPILMTFAIWAFGIVPISLT